MANPSKEHLKGITRVAKYLKGIALKGIEYKTTGFRIQGNKLGLYRAVDADFATNTDDAKSVTGYIFFMVRGPVLWQLKKQSVVAKSTPEAKYIALSEAAGEAV